MMTRITYLIPFLLHTLFFGRCVAQSGDVVDVATLRTEIAKGNVQLVDVRTPHEWSTGRIAGARHIDWFSDDFKTEIGKLDKDAPVRLYCGVGGRSEEAREMLREMGFKDVKDLDGGMGAWKQAGAPIER